MKNMSTLYQHLRSELVPPRVKTMAAAWQGWHSVQEGAGETIHIDYDGEYGSERVLIVSGRATVVPDDGSPSFTVATGDAVYFMQDRGSDGGQRCFAGCGCRAGYTFASLSTETRCQASFERATWSGATRSRRRRDLDAVG